MVFDEPVIDRRALITGRLAGPDHAVTPLGGEIASVLVQARPERLAEVEAQIAALAGCEVRTCDPNGRLIVVIRTSLSVDVGSALSGIADTRYVLSATLSDSTRQVTR